MHSTRRNSGQASKCLISYLPIFFAVWQLIGWIITYTVSLNNGHIDPVLPFISHTGVKLPESALFTLIHSVSSVTGALIIYIRFRQVQLFQPACQKHSRSLWKINVISLGLGELASLGLFFVAYFPQDVNHSVVYWIHCSAAMLNFSTGVIYQLLQAVITRLMHPEVINIRYFWIRFAIAAFGICGYAISMTAGIVISVKTKDQKETGWGASNLDWKSSSNTKNFLYAFAIGEWMVGIGFVLFFLTYYYDFYNLRFNCSIDNERAIQLRLPVGEGFESSNGTSVGGGNRYIYQIESNQSSSREQFNQSNSTKPPITNHTDIVTTSTTSIN